MSTSFVDDDGTTRFRGTLVGGAAPAGALQIADFLFTEEATAGVYTATMAVAAGTTVCDVKLIPLAAWQADAAAIGMGDTLTAADAYFDPQQKDIQSICPNPYDPASPSTDDNYATLGSDGNTYTDNEIWGQAGAPQPPGVLYVAADTLTITIDTTGMSNAPVVPSGRLLVRVYLHTAPTPIAATFA